MGYLIQLMEMCYSGSQFESGISTHISKNDHWEYSTLYLIINVIQVTPKVGKVVNRCVYQCGWRLEQLTRMQIQWKEFDPSSIYLAIPLGCEKSRWKLDGADSNYKQTTFLTLTQLDAIAGIPL